VLWTVGIRVRGFVSVKQETAMGGGTHDAAFKPPINSFHLVCFAVPYRYDVEGSECVILVLM